MERLSQISTFLTALVALGGFVALLIEYRRSNSIKRADYIDKLIERFRGDTDIRDIMYLFQYGGFIYDEDFHDGDNDIERKVDKALMYLSYVCYLKSKRIITKREFSFFEAEVLQALSNPGVIDYLFNLYHFETRKGMLTSKGRNNHGRFTFSHLLRYAREKNLIDKSFFYPESVELGLYHHFLNF